LVYSTRDVAMKMGGARLHLEGPLSIFAERQALGAEIDVGIRAPEARIRIGAGQRAPPIVRDVEGQMSTTSFDVSVPWRIARGEGRGTVDVPDLRALNDFQDRQARMWSIEQGRGQVRATFQIPKGKPIEATVDARFEQAVVEAGHRRFSLRGATGRSQLRDAGITAHVDASDLAVSSSGGSRSLEVRSAEIDGNLPRGSPLRRAEIRGALKGIALRWDEVESSTGNARIAARWVGEVLRLEGDAVALRFRSYGGPPRGWSADTEVASLTTNLEKAPGGVRGPLHIELRNVVGVIHNTAVSGNVTTSLAINDASPKGANVAGSVHVRNGVIRPGEHEARDWWADISFEQGHVETTRDFDCAGRVRAQFRNGLPALYVLANQGKIPAWVPRQFPLRGAKLDLTIDHYHHWTDILVTRATGQYSYAMGRVQIEQGQARGALLFRLSSMTFVSVGLDFVDQPGATYFVENSWLDERLSVLERAAREKHPAPPAPAAELGSPHL
jgi:hypothetical protein